MEKTEKEVTLTLGGAIEYKTTIPEALAVQIMMLCIQGTKSASPSFAPPATTSEPSIKESVAEYVIRIGAKRNPDKILAFAMYLREQQQKQSVSSAELRLMFRDAGEPLPANFTRDFNDTTTSGWLAPEPQKKGYYYVTRTGLDIVNNGFEKAPVKRLKKSTSNKKTTSNEQE